MKTFTKGEAPRVWVVQVSLAAAGKGRSWVRVGASSTSAVVIAQALASLLWSVSLALGVCTVWYMHFGVDKLHT